MLSHFARDVLVVPVSTVSSEATFSTVGRIIEPRRSSLTPDMVEALTCLKDWEMADERTQHQLEDLEIAEAIADLENLDVNWPIYVYVVAALFSLPGVPYTGGKVFNETANSVFVLYETMNKF